MRVTSTRLGAIILVAMLCFAPAGTAGRRHGDVENIGNRDINGSIWLLFPNFISLEKEIEIGAQLAAQFEQTARLIEDPVIAEYVDKVGQNVVRHSDAKVPFHIKVVDTDEVNAFAFPGGYFYVNKGLILAADNEAELTGVIAHEISHITARHATERLSKAQILQLASIPALFIGGYGSWTQVGIQNALGLGINLELLGITRESEKEADQLGIQYQWNTGYDPGAFVTFFEKLQKQEKTKPGRLAGWFRTHPYTEERIALCIDEQRYLPEKDNYIVDSSEFQRVKARMLAIDNAQKGETITSSIEQKRPTLKRRTDTGSGDPTDPDETGKAKKDRPTLKRPGDPPPPPDR